MPQTNDHCFRRLLPGSVISAGTQVVLKVSKPIPGRQETKPPGSVGVVLQSPPNNREPYLIQFADGQTVTALFQELALRRREVEDELGEVTEDLRPWIIYRCQVGSKAFGLATEDSDDDLRGIYLPPARLHWSLRRLPEQLESSDQGRDEVYWELGKFLRLALKANPSVLETLWTPLVLDADDTALELRAMQQAFLSKHIYKTYSGYVLSQFRRMANSHRNRGTYKPKHAMHLIRLLHSGVLVQREMESVGRWVSGFRVVRHCLDLSPWCCKRRGKVGVDLPPLTLEHKTELDGTEVELVSHEVGKYLRLLLRNNGYVLEQVFSPIVVLGQSFLDELRPLARRCITRHHYHHYRGFYATQRRLIEKEEPKRAKPILYAYRVLMTGIHLLRTGEVEANLLRLNEHFRFPFLDELVARKVAENAPAGDPDWPFHAARLAELEARLDRAFEESTLPEDRDRKAVHEFLVQLRLADR